MKRFAYAGLLAVLVLAIGLVVACGDDSGSTSASGGGPLTKVTLMLDWTPNNNHAGIYVARQKGWYKDIGLDVNIVEPGQSGVEQVVGTGQADFGISVSEALLPARAAGAPVVSIATIFPHNDSSLMALTKSGIKRPRDLQGKTYGGFGGQLEHQLIDTLVSCDGGDPAKVKFVEVGNVDYLAGEQRGLFDIVWVFEGWDMVRARAVEKVDVSSIKFADYLKCIPDWYTPVIITNENTIKQRPELVQKFLDATSRGYEYAMKNADDTAALLLQAAPELDATLVKAAAAYQETRYANPGKQWGVQDQAIWSNFAKFLRTSGLLEKDVDVKAAFTNDYLPK